MQLNCYISKSLAAKSNGSWPPMEGAKRYIFCISQLSKSGKREWKLSENWRNQEKKMLQYISSCFIFLIGNTSLCTYKYIFMPSFPSTTRRTRKQESKIPNGNLYISSSFLLHPSSHCEIQARVLVTGQILGYVHHIFLQFSGKCMLDFSLNMFWDATKFTHYVAENRDSKRIIC